MCFILGGVWMPPYICMPPVSGSVPGPSGHLWLRGLPWSVGMRLVQVARSLLVAVSPPVLLRLGDKDHGGQCS